ncbi:MAG: PCP reductase family protein, partial [Nitrospirota bacterium]
TSRQFMPPLERIAEETIAWTKEAEERMNRVPSIARGMAKMAILRCARESGHTVVTSAVVDQTMENLLPASAREAMGILVKEAVKRQSPSKDSPLIWTDGAIERLNRVPAGFMRENTRLRIEKYARVRGETKVTEEIASNTIGESKDMMQNMGKMTEVFPGMSEGKEE